MQCSTNENSLWILKMRIDLRSSRTAICSSNRSFSSTQLWWQTLELKISILYILDRLYLGVLKWMIGTGVCLMIKVALCYIAVPPRGCVMHCRKVIQCAIKVFLFLIECWYIKPFFLKKVGTRSLMFKGIVHSKCSPKHGLF